MNILITNDDGISAPCLKVLARKLEEINLDLSEFINKEELSGSEGTRIFDPVRVIVVAPKDEKSTTSHTITLRNPLHLRPVAPNFWSVDGFPADCVILGVKQIFKELQLSMPDLVISGINRGGNLAQDVFYSGTVAAAREASFAEIPSIAASLAVEFAENFPNRPEDYEGPATLIKRLVLEILKEGVIKKRTTPLEAMRDFIPPKSFLNINIPYLKPVSGIKITSPGWREYQGELRALMNSDGSIERDHFYLGTGCQGHRGTVDSDCGAVDQGLVSVTPYTYFSSYCHQAVLSQLLAKISLAGVSSRSQL